MTSANDLVHLLIDRHLTVGVAESLTGGLLVSELVKTPGASATVLGGIVAYHTELKHTVLGVDTAVLNVHGAVHPDVAAQMAARVRDAVAVGGVPADVGVATTGVAGPEEQDGQAVGTVFIGVSVNGDVRVSSHAFDGGRDEIRAKVVAAAINEIFDRLTADAE